MSRPIQATIFPAAVAHNLQIVRRHCGAAKIWAVVKANGYGHGLALIFDGLQAANGLAVLDLAEAELLRQLGWQGPILLLEGFFEATELPRIAALDLTPVIHCAAQLTMLERAQQEQQIPGAISTSIAVYLKLNSGMNRLGFTAAAYRDAYQRLRALSLVRELTLMSHFANADAPVDDPSGMAPQLACFNAASAALPGPRSLANSAAIFDHPATHLDWVRPGIMLYGATPFPDRSAAQLGLRPAMRLTSAIIATQQIREGDAVGYGSQFVARRPMRIGIVACGYADGYPRLAPNGTPVMVNGQRAGTVGRVSMDMLMVDLSALPDAGVGSPVELWGDQLSVDVVAQAAGTVGYELLCALAPRVPVQQDKN
jgi:alanine racemase